MIGTLQIFSGDEWEDFCLWLLQDRHGPLNVHKVPAKDKGDQGLDYYCITDRVVYQSYAVDEPISVAVRAEKQKAKMTVDLGKFVHHASDIALLFSGSLIQHWVLLVPLHDSKSVNQHAGKKTAELRGMNLLHIDPSFEVGVQDLANFNPAAVEARTADRETIRITLESVQEQDITALTQSQPELLNNLQRKLLKRIATGGAPIDSAAQTLIEQLLQRDNVLDKLRGAAPELHDKIQSAISRRLRHLSTIGTTATTVPAIMGGQFDDLRQEIAAAIPNLDKEAVDTIAYGTIASWLMICHLDFPPYDAVA